MAPSPEIGIVDGLFYNYVPNLNTTPVKTFADYSTFIVDYHTNPKSKSTKALEGVVKPLCTRAFNEAGSRKLYNMYKKSKSPQDLGVEWVVCNSSAYQDLLNQALTNRCITQCNTGLKKCACSVPWLLEAGKTTTFYTVESWKPSGHFSHIGSKPSRIPNDGLALKS
jgi:hypothetical protein